jgi:hypothetical protein
MTVFQGAVHATFAAFGIDAVYTPAGGEPIPVRVVAKRGRRFGCCSQLPKDPAGGASAMATDVNEARPWVDSLERAMLAEPELIEALRPARLEAKAALAEAESAR